MGKFINILAQRLIWDDKAMSYPQTAREDCLRNAIREVIEEAIEKQATKDRELHDSIIDSLDNY